MSDLYFFLQQLPCFVTSSLLICYFPRCILIYVTYEKKKGTAKWLESQGSAEFQAKHLNGKIFIAGFFDAMCQQAAQSTDLKQCAIYFTSFLCFREKTILQNFILFGLINCMSNKNTVLLFHTTFKYKKTILIRIYPSKLKIMIFINCKR